MTSQFAHSFQIMRGHFYRQQLKIYIKSLRWKEEVPAATPIDLVQLEPRTDQTIVSAVREPVFISVTMKIMLLSCLIRIKESLR